ncbi:hypothetical protein D030_3653A, partial [Vibrio parahaemolyticus AQ3810]
MLSIAPSISGIP